MFELRPSIGSRLASKDNSPPDLPLAVAESTNLYTIHADHLGRPIRMTDAAKATVWQATWKPWGEPHAISGTIPNNNRFPGQYFQLETTLHYNWHRHYDPVTGRYTQPDPLRFVDGPSIYAYAGNSPLIETDRTGLVAYPNSPRPPSSPSSGAPSGGVQMCGWSESRETCHDLCFQHLFDGSGVGSYRKCLRACLPPDERDNF